MLPSTDPALRKFPGQETNQGIPQSGISNGLGYADWLELAGSLSWWSIAPYNGIFLASDKTNYFISTRVEEWCQFEVINKATMQSYAVYPAGVFTGGDISSNWTGSGDNCGLYYVSADFSPGLPAGTIQMLADGAYMAFNPVTGASAVQVFVYGGYVYWSDTTGAIGRAPAY